MLFVCVHNAGRSQMAAAFLTHFAGDRVEVRSAGSTPADTVNPAVVDAMKEVGIDISAETPKVLTVEAVQTSDVVITMGCGDTCPVFPGSGTWIGSSTIRPGRESTTTRSARSETRSSGASAAWWPNLPGDREGVIRGLAARALAPMPTASSMSPVRAATTPSVSRASAARIGEISVPSGRADADRGSAWAAARALSSSTITVSLSITMAVLHFLSPGKDKGLTC